MITELTNSDNAGTVVSRINTAIDEQNKGVDTLGANPNAGTVISRVNAAIDAESNDQLEDVTSSDNAADFIRKVNDLFASIRNGGGSGDEPTPDPDYVPTDADYAYWNGANYIAFGDSITHVSDSWSGGPYLNQRYCFLVSQSDELNMNFTNKGVSGMLMLYNGAYNYDPNNDGTITTTRVETPQRSFAYELLDPDDMVTIAAGVSARGPYGVDLLQYDLISIMFGTNDIDRIRCYEKAPRYQPEFAEVGSMGDTALTSFYGAYCKALDHILKHKKNDAVVVVCIPPNATYHDADDYFDEIGDLVTPITNIANSLGLPIVDFYNNCTVDLKSDGVHPNADGQAVMAAYFKLRLGQIVHELNLRNA